MIVMFFLMLASLPGPGGLQRDSGESAKGLRTLNH